MADRIDIVIAAQDKATEIIESVMTVAKLQVIEVYNAIR